MTAATDSIADLYDHEVEDILRVQRTLQARAQAKKFNYGHFDEEIRNRFREIGFEVSVNWYEFAIGGTPQEGAMPEVTIDRRVEKVAWDPDRQVHEAVHDVLGLGDSGWIKTDPDTLKNFRDGNGGHGHGHHH